MSRIGYAWESTAPPKPDVYTTRRNQSKYLTLRYWDGSCWYEVAWGNSRGGAPFKVYDEKEVLAYLVQTGVLPADWKTAYQAEMRGAA